MAFTVEAVVADLLADPTEFLGRTFGVQATTPREPCAGSRPIPGFPHLAE